MNRSTPEASIRPHAIHLTVNHSNGQLQNGPRSLRTKSLLVLLVQRGHGLAGLDLVQAEGEGEAAGQLLDAAHVG